MKNTLFQAYSSLNPFSLPPDQLLNLLSQSFSQSFRSFLPTSLTQLFLPLARDCASWVPAADISTVIPSSDTYLSNPHGFHG